MDGARALRSGRGARRGSSSAGARIPAAAACHSPPLCMNMAISVGSQSSAGLGASPALLRRVVIAACARCR